MKIAPAILATTVVLALAACAPTATTSPEDPAPAASVAPQPVGTAGVYDVDFAAFTGIYTLLDDGRFYGLHFVGQGLAGHPFGQLSDGDTALTPEPIAWANFIDDARKVGAMETEGVFGRRFSDTEVKFVISGSMGRFADGAESQRPWYAGAAESLYNDPIDSIAGTYSGFVRSAGLELTMEDVTGLAIDDAGHFTVSALTCEIEGDLTQHGDTGVFDVVATASGCGLQPAIEGIVVPLSVVDGVPQLAFELNTVDATQSVVFIVSRG
jgi:hypothetical protein